MRRSQEVKYLTFLVASPYVSDE